MSDDISALPARPLIKAGLRRLWRDPSTLQLGIDPRHAVVLRDVTSAERAVLALLDGTRDVEAVVLAAADVGLSRHDVVALLRELARVHVVDDAAAPLPRVAEGDRQRLEPDLMSLSLVQRGPGAAARALAARAEAHVVVHGGGRVGATTAMLLAAGGVGQLSCLDDAALRGADVAPGGVRSTSAMTRGEAVEAAIRDFAPHAARPIAGGAASLAVVAPAGCFVRPETAAVVRSGPHLFVGVHEATAVVGPFVLPGVSPCLRCVQMSRGDRDGGWPMLAAQLVSSSRVVDPCDVGLATFAASLAAIHVLRWIDGHRDVATVGGVLELSVDDWRLRRRTVRPHPACGCRAGADDQAIALSDETSASLSA